MRIWIVLSCQWRLVLDGRKMEETRCQQLISSPARKGDAKVKIECSQVSKVRPWTSLPEAGPDASKFFLWRRWR